MSHSVSQASSVVGGAVAVGAEEPETKRRRLLDAGGPVEDEETAWQKMRDANVGEPNGEITGFDLDDLEEFKALYGESNWLYRISPMGYFAKRGDLPMMRWLYVNGADTRGPDLNIIPFHFPMNAAAVGFQYEAVEWLYTRGPPKDATRCPRGSYNVSPLTYLFLSRTNNISGTRCAKWMVLNGAFCQSENDSGVLDVKTMKLSLGRASNIELTGKRFADARKDLLDWAVELHQARFSFLTFLRGTLARQDGKATSPIACLNGKASIMELVAEYSGVVLGRKASIVRQLVELLPSIYKELEDIEEGWANESDSESESDGESDGESY